MTKKRVIAIIIIILISTVLFSDPPDWEVITGTQYNMILMAQVEFNLELFDNTDDNMVGAFGPGGEQDCRSIGVWLEPNPPYWDGYWYFTIVGNIEGEDISFKIYDSETEAIYGCYETILFEDNATIGIPIDLFELTCGETAIDNILQTNERIMLANYPNPFSGSTTIEYGIKGRLQAELVEIKIYNVAGQLVEIIEARYGTAKWNPGSLSTGVYFYQLKTENYNEVKKLVIVHK